MASTACRNFCYKVMPVVLQRIRQLTPRSLSNLVFAIGVLGLKLDGNTIEAVGLALCEQLRYTSGKQLGNACIGIATVPRWTPYRRRSISKAIEGQAQALIKARLFLSTDVRASVP
jgi:hypothetical protein